jgi:hypothetical protein
MLTSPSSIRQRKPLRGPRTTTSSFGTETSSSHNRVWKASSAPTAVIPTVPISPDLAGSQPIRQAPPRWIGHKLRFAFRWYSALLKRCWPRGQSARRTHRLPHERAPAPKNQRAQVSQGEICPKETPQNHARMPQECDSSQNESLSLVRLDLFVAASDNQARKHAVSGDISKRLRPEPGSFDGITCMIRRPSPAQSRGSYVDAAEAARFLSIHLRTLQQL